LEGVEFGILIKGQVNVLKADLKALADLFQVFGIYADGSSLAIAPS
jgi:hypothetical protein